MTRWESPNSVTSKILAARYNRVHHTSLGPGLKQTKQLHCWPELPAAGSHTQQGRVQRQPLFLLYCCPYLQMRADAVAATEQHSQQTDETAAEQPPTTAHVG